MVHLTGFAALAGRPGKRRERFASVERGDITLFLPWMMEYTRRASARRSDLAREATDEAKLKREYQHVATRGV